MQAFQRIHAAIQEAWSTGDLGSMRRLMTPEMLSYFSEELSRNTSRGLHNIIGNVQLVKGELTEAWEEGDLQYATAALRWRAIDYVQRLGAPAGDRNALVSGDPRTPGEFEEVWTFVRQRGGELAALSDPTGLITDDGVAIDRQLQVIVCGIAASRHPRGSRAHLAAASDGYSELGNAFFGSRRAASVAETPALLSAPRCA